MRGIAPLCLFLCTHYIGSLDGWLGYRRLKNDERFLPPKEMQQNLLDIRGFAVLSNAWKHGAAWQLVAIVWGLKSLKAVYKKFLNFSLGLEWVRPKAVPHPQDKKLFQQLCNQREKTAFLYITALILFLPPMLEFCALPPNAAGYL